MARSCLSLEEDAIGGEMGMISCDELGERGVAPILSRCKLFGGWIVRSLLLISSHRFSPASKGRAGGG